MDENVVFKFRSKKNYVIIFNVLKGFLVSCKQSKMISCSLFIDFYSNELLKVVTGEQNIKKHNHRYIYICS